MDVLSYLEEKGIKPQVQGSEAIITCPECGKEKLSINIQTQLYQCWHCQAINPDSKFAKGHFSTLQRFYGDLVDIVPIAPTKQSNNQEEVDLTSLVETYHYNLTQTKHALRYLAKRGITNDSIKRFKLGFTTRYGGDEWIVIPSSEDGVFKLLKLRNLTNVCEKCGTPNKSSKEYKCSNCGHNKPRNKKYIREKGSKSILFNGDVINNFEDIIVTEGELDAISLIQLGYDNVVGTTGGATTLLHTWYDNLLYTKKILLCFDADKVGQKACREVWAKRLGFGRTWNLVLPEGEDLNSYLQNHTKEEFEIILKGAYQFKVDGISSIKDVLYYDMYQKANEEGEEEVYTTPWKSVNEITDGGLHRGELWVIGAIPGTGKTSFSLQLMYHVAKTYNIPSLFFCLEMPKAELAIKVLQLEKDMTRDEIRYGDALLYANDVEHIPMYFGYDSRITPEKFAITVEECRNRYGVELFVFDNLHLCIRSDKESDVSKASKIFKQIVMDLDIMGVLISQPRKTNNDSNITYDMLKGSSAIPADGDDILLMSRLRAQGITSDTSFSPETKIRNDKGRLGGGGIRQLIMIGEKSRFEEIKKNGN